MCNRLEHRIPKSTTSNHNSSNNLKLHRRREQVKTMHKKLPNKQSYIRTEYNSSLFTGYFTQSCLNYIRQMRNQNMLWKTNICHDHKASVCGNAYF